MAEEEKKAGPQASAREVYSVVSRIFRAEADALLADRVADASLMEEDAKKTKALVQALPDPEKATDLELRIVLHEANAGALETFWSKLDSSTRTSLRNYYDLNGGHYSNEVLFELSHSPIFQPLQALRPQTYTDSK